MAYHAILKDMQHLGFSDMKYAIPFKSQVGKLDPAVAHDTVCSIHLEFFDTYLKKTKDEPLGTGLAAHYLISYSGPLAKI